MKTRRTGLERKRSSRKMATTRHVTISHVASIPRTSRMDIFFSIFVSFVPARKNGSPWSCPITILLYNCIINTLSSLNSMRCNVALVSTTCRMFILADGIFTVCSTRFGRRWIALTGYTRRVAIKLYCSSCVLPRWCSINTRVSF